MNVERELTLSRVGFEAIVSIKRSKGFVWPTFCQNKAYLIDILT